MGQFQTESFASIVLSVLRLTPPPDTCTRSLRRLMLPRTKEATQ